MGLSAGREQRRFRRVSTEMPVRYRVSYENGELGPQEESVTTNISCQGIAFESNLSIPVTARVALEIVLPGASQCLKCDAVVMRIARELPDDKGFEYGVQFEKDTLSDSKLLDQVVRSIDVVPLLERMIREGATDMHLSAFTPPTYRVHRNLQSDPKARPLAPETVEALLCGTLNSERKSQLYKTKELDFPFMIPELGRWRINAFYQKGFMEATFHNIDLYIPSVTELNLPDSVRTLALSQSGLIIISGSSSSGKSTTLAAMIGAINENEEKVVVTVEDPIEYVHQNDRSIIKQREVGSDTDTVQDALKNILRQDPDVIVVDDIPDKQSMSTVLRAAESGRLVLIAFPTQGPLESINRILSFYPRTSRTHVLHSISGCLRAVISQWLLPTIDHSGYALASEVMTVSDSIKNAIWMDKLEQLQTFMTSAPGAQTLDSSLRNLIVRGMIDFGSASQVAHDPDSLRRNIVV